MLPSRQAIYGDEPASRAKSTVAISMEPHPPNLQEAAAAQRALDRRMAQLLRDAAEAARSRQLDTRLPMLMSGALALGAPMASASDYACGGEAAWVVSPKLVRERRSLQN